MNNLDLFPEALQTSGQIDGHFRDVVSRYGYQLDDVDIGDITFQAGQQESIHRWFRLTPSFAPGVVRYFLNEFRAIGDEATLVLDPFSGRGTTAIECQKLGVKAHALEINPLLANVGSQSLMWRPIRKGAFDA